MAPDTAGRRVDHDGALLMMEFHRRRERDALARFEPTAKQHPFIQAVLRAEKSEHWFIAANRSGKSDAGAYCGAMLARYGVDPLRLAYSEGGAVAVADRATSAWVAAVDSPVSQQVIQPKYFDNGFKPPGQTHPPFIPQREIDQWRSSDQLLKLRNGSIIVFKSYDSGRTKFQGAGKDWIHFDEEPPKDIYEESVIRVEAGRRLRVFGTCTLLPPEGHVGGVSWIYQEIIQKVASGERSDVGLYGSSIYDNPHIGLEEIRKAEAVYPEGSVQRRIRLGGEWLPGLSGARVYVAFDRRLHVRPQAWPPAPRRPLCWVWDFNVEPMVTLVGQRDLKLFRGLRCFVLDEGSIPEMCDLFRSEVPTHMGEIWLYGDATGKSRTGQTGQSDYQLVLNCMRSAGQPVRLKVPEQNPPVRDRVNAVNRALRNEQGESMVEVDPSCADLIADLEQVISDGRGGIRKTFNRRDPYYRRTHTSDALGYWISWEEPVRSFTAGIRSTVSRIVSPGYAWSRT